MNLLTFSSSKCLRLAAVCLLLLSGSFSFSQDTTTAVIDSLIVELMKEPEDTSKVQLYNSLSDEYLPIDYTRSVEYSDLAHDLSENIKYDLGLLTSSLALAHINASYIQDFESAKSYYDEALPLAQKLADKTAELAVMRGLSNLFSSNKKWDQAMDYNQKAVEIAETMNDYAHLSDLYAYRGGMFEDQGDKAAAIDAYAEVLALERKHDFTNTTNAAMIAVARYYYLIEDPGQALKYYKIALKNFERNQDIRWQSYTHAEMAHLFLFKKDPEKAEKHGLRGLEIAENNKLNKEIGDNYLALIAVYTAMDSTSKVEHYTKLYDSLQQSLVPIDGVAELVAPADQQAKKNNNSSGGINGFLQALFILVPVVIGALIAGRPKAKKS